MWDFLPFFPHINPNSLAIRLLCATLSSGLFPFSFCRCCYCVFTFFALLVALCPRGWFNEGSSCYKLSSYRQNWQAAKTACERMGSTLAIVNSQAEQQALKPHIKWTSTWIGLHRYLFDKRRWLWVDRSRLTYTHWARYEPNNIHEECVEMRSSARWNDLRCSRRLRYICEKGNKADTLHCTEYHFTYKMVPMKRIGPKIKFKKSLLLQNVLVLLTEHSSHT